MCMLRGKNFRNSEYSLWNIERKRLLNSKFEFMAIVHVRGGSECLCNAAHLLILSERSTENEKNTKILGISSLLLDSPDVLQQ